MNQAMAHIDDVMPIVKIGSLSFQVGNWRQPRERQDSHRVNCFTTKDTKSTKESKNKALDSILEFCDIEVDQEPDLHPC